MNDKKIYTVFTNYKSFYTLKNNGEFLNVIEATPLAYARIISKDKLINILEKYEFNKNMTDYIIEVMDIYKKNKDAVKEILENTDEIPQKYSVCENLVDKNGIAKILNNGYFVVQIYNEDKDDEISFDDLYGFNNVSEEVIEKMFVCVDVDDVDYDKYYKDGDQCYLVEWIDGGEYIDEFIKKYDDFYFPPNDVFNVYTKYGNDVENVVEIIKLMLEYRKTNLLSSYLTYGSIDYDKLTDYLIDKSDCDILRRMLFVVRNDNSRVKEIIDDSFERCEGMTIFDILDV